MYICRYFGLIFLVVSIGEASPVPLADNVFGEFLRKAQLVAPSRESVVVKRRIFEDNTDGQLKEISLKTLIGDLEKSLFASALNVNKNLTDEDFRISEINGNNNSEHKSLPKENAYVDSISTTTTESSAIISKTDKEILQTTEKITQSSVPTHIVIDRIAIQPHTGGIALIPIFELKRTRKDEDANNDHEITKITISKTEITSLATTPTESTSSFPKVSSSTSSSITTSSSTTEVPSETTTTTKNIEQLKEAEEELKEKVAEIEAEPIILSARV